MAETNKRMKPRDIVTTDQLAELVCHKEQLQIWTDELLDALQLGEFLRDDMTYDDRSMLRLTLDREIKGTIASAFMHPEILG